MNAPTSPDPRRNAAIRLGKRELCGCDRLIDVDDDGTFRCRTPGGCGATWGYGQMLPVESEQAYARRVAWARRREKLYAVAVRAWRILRAPAVRVLRRNERAWCVDEGDPTWWVIATDEEHAVAVMFEHMGYRDLEHYRSECGLRTDDEDPEVRPASHSTTIYLDEDPEQGDPTTTVGELLRRYRWGLFPYRLLGGTEY